MYCLDSEMVPNFGMNLSVPFSRMSCRYVSFQFPAYPSLLKPKGDECQLLLLLHADDVLCLCRRNYLDETLMPSLKLKYKVACETICKADDELPFLKRRT